MLADEAVESVSAVAEDLGCLGNVAHLARLGLKYLL